MRKMENPPTNEQRGDIVLDTKYIPASHLIVPQRHYWQQRAESVSLATGLAGEVARVLASRMGELVTYRRLYDDGLEFTEAQLAEFQVSSSSTLAMSRLLRRQHVNDYMQQSRIAVRSEGTITNLDPGGVSLQWHVLHGEEARLIEGYVPSSEPETWYEESSFYLHVSQPADPTAAFRDSYREFYEGDRFVPENYTTITPVLPRDVLQPVE